MALDDPGNGDGGGNAQSAFQYFVNQGMSPAQAAGIVGNLQGESGQGLNTGALNPKDGRDGSDSIGIAQWNGTRAQALKNYADSKGTPWTDLNTQLEFLHSELKGPEASVYKGLQAAQTPEDAARAMLAYERPKDWNVPGSHPERAKYALAIHSAYGGGQPVPPQQTAQASPQSPPNTPLQLAPKAPPIFPPQQQAPQQAQQGGGSLFGQMPPDQGMQAPPIFYAPRKPPNIQQLQAALQASGNRGLPIFGRG